MANKGALWSKTPTSGHEALITGILRLIYAVTPSFTFLIIIVNMAAILK